MKNYLLALLCMLFFGFTQAQSTIYVSPTGSASNPGTSISAPTTLENAIATVTAGGTIYMRGGTYSYSTTIVIADNNNGTSSANKRIMAYNGEVPVLDFSGQATADSNRGLVLDGDYWYIYGITFKGAGDNGMLLAGNNNTVEKCIFSNNRDTGLQLSRYKTTNTTLGSWPSNNLILNCEAFDNRDPGNENADGFAAKLTCGTGNVFRGCIAHHNIDDGWDFYAKDDTGPIGVVTLENCVAYSNGSLTTGGTSGSGDKNGFKLGGSGIAVNHIVRRCVAFSNGHHGFTDNNNPGNIEVSNNTSYNNAESNYNFRTGSTATFRNNISLNAGASDKSNGTEVGNSNVWWKNNVSTNSGSLVISAADFITVTPSVTKNSDGSPNLGNFLALASGSDMINAGVTAPGITYNGSAPDLGARESNGTAPLSYTLTTTSTPSAGGSIARTPNASTYTAGTTVTLVATAATGYTFTGWTGSSTSTNATITVTMDANKSLTANFTTNTSTSYTLTTTASPSAGGSITRSPNAATYAAGTVVTLTATPSSGYTFSNWSGAISSTSPITTVTINANTSVTANFNATSTGGGNTLRIDDDASTANGYCGADGSRQNSYTGADGGYYINLSNSASKGVNYSVNAPTAGTYSLKWRYANGGSSVSTTARVLVNGSTVVSNIQFPVTTNWNTWNTTATVNVTLVAGVNTIRLETTEAKEFANIDWMEVTGNAPTAAACSGSARMAAATSTQEYVDVKSNILQVFPNPVHSQATVRFYNPAQGKVVIGLYDMQGSLVKTVVNRDFPQGEHQVTVDCSTLVTATYLIRIDAQQFKSGVKLMKQ
ncbi:putative repeat protein (TIGR02543 family)/predicted secreted protein (Por secretion system target) [Chitinophaga skermanii]|uniref:Putative repeat protein (TIGR02543 family)/predicted secreted protein (Por secretion system target) n=1 Tax=Chitinophaga skermanii TaxID=331697 RepID=A0A327QQA5_9BACT|nr:carbohydrate-binding protein [Chitinophaga skermanii]RAJ06530.1 putative repeat protein (TIGR02543 family)/predicted secreted protein (Por secretion system target) [Chitinophaga skermanii]